MCDRCCLANSSIKLRKEIFPSLITEMANLEMCEERSLQFFCFFVLWLGIFSGSKLIICIALLLSDPDYLNNSGSKHLQQLILLFGIGNNFSRQDTVFKMKAVC